jgi:hypothetical protein
MNMQNQVFEAAEKLKSMGQPVTNVAVRTQLGGGSMTTIAPLLRKWKSDNQPTVIEEQDVPGFVLEAAKQVYKTIKDEMEAEVRRIRSEAHAAITAAETERDEALMLTDELEKELSIIKDEFKQQSEETLRLEERIKETNRICEKLDDKRKTAEQAAKRLESQLERKDEQITQLLTTLKTEQTPSEQALKDQATADRSDAADKKHPCYPFVVDGKGIRGDRRKIEMIEKMTDPEELEAAKLASATRPTVYKAAMKKWIEMTEIKKTKQHGIEQAK